MFCSILIKNISREVLIQLKLCAVLNAIDINTVDKEEAHPRVVPTSLKQLQQNLNHFIFQTMELVAGLLN